MIGETLLHYEILELLGEGGMGRVYKARDTRLRRLVAVKVLPPEKPVTEDRRRRFLREARAASALNHPAIITVHDIARADGVDFIVMELVSGRSLDRSIPETGLPWRETVRVAHEIAEAMAVAHAEGIVHRDLKPLNVMVDEDGRVKVLDFGIAKLDPTADAAETSDTLTRPGTTVGHRPGTLAYMSPEQFLGEPIDARSDIFSFGVVLHEMLTGERPFRGPNEAVFLHQLLYGEPPAVRDAHPEIPDPLAKLARRCLERQRTARPQTMAEIAAALRRLLGTAPGQEPPTVGDDLDAVTPGTAPAARGPAEAAATLRSWPEPELPAQPYPVLLPYAHPALMAGREREIAELETLLQRPVPILGLQAPSGTGKSSLLAGGLVPELRSERAPVALVRHPQEPGIVGRLLDDLLEGGPRPDDDDWQGFAEQLEEVERLAGKAPVLVVDQLEEVLRPQAIRPRVVLGVLLAATARPRAGRSPICRWLLAHRQESHGELFAWLRDVLYDARSAEAPGIDALPHDLSGHHRFHHMTLLPLATPPRGGDGAEITRIFRAAIEKPLALTTPDGARRYPWRFAPGHAECLARSFTKARLAHPEAPLTPELQVALARLMERAGDDGVLEVPPDSVRWIDEALENHLRRALAAAFPSGQQGAATRRARALLALRELADASERGPGEGRDDGLPAATLAGAIGEDGERILADLATPRTRLVVPLDAPEGLRYVLSHQRMAAAVVHLVEEEGLRGGLLVDAELLALRRVVALKTALYRSHEKQATRLPRRHFRRIAAHAEALVWDEERRAWWAACRKRRRANRLRSAARAAAALVVLAFLALGVTLWARQVWERRTLPEQVVHGEPQAAMWAIDRLATRFDADPSELIALVRRRDFPTDVVEHPSIWGGDDDARWVLRLAAMALPWVEETPDDPVLIANLTRRLDFLDAPFQSAVPWAARDHRLLAQARELRDRVLEPLRRRRPPPDVPPDLAEIPPGRLVAVIGYPGSRREITVPAFRMLRHEVTTAEVRRLWPGFNPGVDDDLPARPVTWYQAYTYAAWLGGRLPTEAEWVHAARAGCPHDYCSEDGGEAKIDKVAWWVGNSRDPQTGFPAPQPAMRLAANPWGLHDMLGNVKEWTSDWIFIGIRVNRGSDVSHPSWLMGAETRSVAPAEDGFVGFRIVFPDPNLPPAVEVTTPLPGATVPSGSDLTLSADAFDVDGSISKVDFYARRGAGGDDFLGGDATEPYGISWSDAADGCYAVRAEAVDDGGGKASDEAHVVVGTCPQLPYHGEPLAIPGVIEAESFDLGLSGEAYLDRSPGNLGGAYRTETGVDVERTWDAGGGFNVGWSDAGEWMEYTVDVAAAGDYDLYVRVASQATGGTFHVELDGVDRTGPMGVPVTGGFQSWATVSTTVRLEAGVQVMRWHNDAAGEHNLNYFRFVAAGGSFCGDGACDAGEDCASCATDCAGVTDGWPPTRHCCGNGVAEPAEGDGSICGGNH